MSGKSYGSIQVTNDADPKSPTLAEPQSDTEWIPFLSINDTDAEGDGQTEAGWLKGWSDLTFQWISPLLALGNARGQLDVSDLKAWPLPKHCETREVYERFAKCWQQELDRLASSNKESVSLSQGHNAVRDEMELELKHMQQGHSDSQSAHQPSLIRALFRAFGADFLRAGLYKLVHDANLFVGPQVLNHLIRFLRDKEAPLSHGLALTLLVTASQILMSVTLRHYFYKCYTCGLQIRTAMVIAIYKKALLLSLKERHAHGGPGEIANLVGIDTQRMQDLMTYLHAIWYSFFQIGLAMYFLWGQVGHACLSGVVIILVLIPTTQHVSAYLSRIQKQLLQARDQRTALNNEVLGAMKILKLQAWEENFLSKLFNLRSQELLHLKRYFFGSALSVSLYSSTPLLVALATFATCTLSGKVLDVAQSLTALALLDVLRFPLFMLPQILNRIVEAGLSVERVREFLLCEEYQRVGEGHLLSNGEVSIKNGTFVYDSKKPPLVEESEIEKKQESGGRGNLGKLRRQHRLLLKRTVWDRTWEMMLLKAQLMDAEEKIRLLQTQQQPKLVCDPERVEESGESQSMPEDKWSPSSLLSLRRIYLHCRPGEFVAVVGAVGSGKSTLIHSILGEGRPLFGTELACKGKLGVFLQSPFIMNDTVRNNILFGHAPLSSSPKNPIDESRYELALKICSLSHDLKLLSAGDQTEIGERGITMSGGQKARVALARAVYHDADIYLLDDPLAAVDAHVGKDLFHKCIVEEMLLGKSKRQNISNNGGERSATIILVTNALQYLSHPMVDRIICLNDGCIEEVGTFSALSSNPASKFASFLAVMAETSKVTSREETLSSDEKKEVLEFDDHDDTSKNALDSSAEPEVFNVIEPSHERKSITLRSSMHTRTEEVDENNSGGILMTDELQERGKGSVDRQVYINWAKAGGGLLMGVIILLMFAVVELLTVSSKWWLTHWSQGGGAHPLFFLGIYALINLSAILVTWFRIMLFNLVGLQASKAIFERLLIVVFDAPMSFFDTTPIGRIINRFSKDMYTIDEQLVQSGRSYLSTMISVISSIVVVLSVTPAFAIALVPIIMFYFNQQSFFTMTYRELKRLDSVTRSPIYALIGETLDGVLTIRAFNAQSNLNNRMINMLDVQQTAFHLTFAAQCWLSVRLEFAGTLIVAFTCLVSVLEHGPREGDAVFAGLAGLSISFALSVTQNLNWTVRMASDVEANMVAVERVQQYSQIRGEAPRETSIDDVLPLDWPSQGRIEFHEAKLRYRSGLPLVLKGLTINIPSQSKVGVVGRTGAGKSTLMVALLRIVELDSGSIKIDGVDIKSVGLKKLRSRIAVIPQDPVLFSGTVRSNLDPFGEYTDQRLIEVLQHVGLYTTTENAASHVLRNSSSLSNVTSSEKRAGSGGRTQPIQSLSETVSEGGVNFSVGQRQLVVIARAMLCGASIVIMDEATASVDADTDARIQQVFRAEFKSATCITVAHRLNTIMDSDFVLVMDDGRAAEFDKPSVLLSKGGIFKGLVDAWEEEN